jgi:aminoglycoside phosphotransferase (APT) family kinase protein
VAIAKPDRSSIDASLARRLIDSQFPQWSGLPITEVEVDGWDNRTFRLGRELTVRLPTGDWYAQQVAKEQRWLPVLAPRLPLPIPTPAAKGAPDDGFPYPWSVYRWLDGELASRARIGDLSAFATALAEFLNALGRVDATDGPRPGEHNFFRGGPLGTYEAEALEAVDSLGDEVPREPVLRAWEDAMATSWEREPVWLHGDVASGNLLVRDGRLAAVLDFGSSGVGDPACDTVIAWTFLSGPSRDRFRADLAVDAATWSRGRGWALWKALITLVGHLENDSPDAALARRDIEQVLADHARD